MNCPVYRLEVSKSASLGAALRAAHAFLKHTGRPAKWPEVMAQFTDPVPGSEVRPNKKAVAVYNKFIKTFAKHEQAALKEQANR